MSHFISFHAKYMQWISFDKFHFSFNNEIGKFLEILSIVNLTNFDHFRGKVCQFFDITKLEGKKKTYIDVCIHILHDFI
jgi:hypothetical protein